MIFTDLVFIPLILLILSAAIILVQISWQKMMVVLGVQYLAVFWLVALNWPFGLALVKLIVGIVVCIVLGAISRETSLKYSPEVTDPGFVQLEQNPGKARFSLSPAQVFRAFLALLGLILAFSLSPGISSWLPGSRAVELNIVLGGIVLVTVGLLQLGMTNLPGRSVVGLLTVLSGFEIIYAQIEYSVLVAGLLAVINLGLALTAVYIHSISALSAQDGEGGRE